MTTADHGWPLSTTLVHSDQSIHCWISWWISVNFLVRAITVAYSNPDHALVTRYYRLRADIVLVKEDNIPVQILLQFCLCGYCGPFSSYRDN